MDDKYYCSVDFLRIFFCLCVIVGHIYIILGLGNDSEVIITMQNMSVDSFFIISGLFMAQSCNKLLNSSDESTSKEYIFLKYQYKRVSKLYPLYITTTIIYIAKDILWGKINLIQVIDYWPVFFFCGQINGFPNTSGIWYVCSLIWIGMIISAFILFWNKKSVVVVFPILIFLTFSYMYTYYGNLSLNAYPMIANWFSVGNVKAMCGMSVGVEAYYFVQYYKTHDGQNNISNVIYICIESIAIVGIIYCLIVGGLCKRNFLIYPCTTILLILILLRKDYLLKWTSKFPAVKKLGDASYATYLCHMIIIECVDYYNIANQYNSKIIYLLICVFSFLVGYLLHIMDVKLRKKIRLSRTLG